MSDNYPPITIVGSTPALPGVAEGKACDPCSGEGLVGDPNHGEALVFCPYCEGRGGTDAVAVAAAREFSAAYRRELLGDEPADDQGLPLRVRNGPPRLNRAGLPFLFSADESGDDG